MLTRVLVCVDRRCAVLALWFLRMFGLDAHVQASAGDLCARLVGVDAHVQAWPHGLCVCLSSGPCAGFGLRFMCMLAIGGNVPVWLWSSGACLDLRPMQMFL